MAVPERFADAATGSDTPTHVAAHNLLVIAISTWLLT